jgi:hypothetical protein
LRFKRKLRIIKIMDHYSFQIILFLEFFPKLFMLKFFKKKTTTKFLIIIFIIFCSLYSCLLISWIVKKKKQNTSPIKKSTLTSFREILFKFFWHTTPKSLKKKKIYICFPSFFHEKITSVVFLFEKFRYFWNQ